MNSTKNTDALDEVFNDITEDVAQISDEDVTSAAYEMEQFIENDKMSPVKWEPKQFTGGTGHGFMSTLYYMTEPGGYTENSGLYICSGTIKACPYPIEEFTPDPKTDKDAKPYDTIIIYGHPEDIDDEFSSRFDEDFLWKIPEKFSTKFRRVALSGAFKDIGSMKSVIFELYNKMTTKTREAKIEVYMNSKVKDDEGKTRTIANLIKTGYIKPGILDNPNIVNLRYSQINSTKYATLFTKDLTVAQTTLFDDDDDDSDDEETYGEFASTKKFPF